jgi:hypothetical protein
MGEKRMAQTKKSMGQFASEVADGTLDPNDLNHDERLRGNALALACRYYVETIVKDGDLYREMVRDNRVLKPATYLGVIEVAFSFEAFIRGELHRDVDSVTTDVDGLTEKDRGEPPPSLDAVDPSAGVQERGPRATKTEPADV